MKHMRWWVVLTPLVGLLALGVIIGCGGDDEEDPLARIERIFPSSIHGARPGKATFYSAPDGFATLTHIPIDSLVCTHCHAMKYADGTTVDHETYEPGCRDCHVDPEAPQANPVADSVCLGCHGRQGAEQKLFSDVHRSAGMGCMDCHTAEQMHGDGRQYATFLATGVPTVTCQKCHSTPAANAYHSTHLSKVDCSACHVKSVSSCYNCHFETEVVLEQKRFFAQTPRTGFKMLLNYNGKVHTGTFQTLSYEGKSFVALAPFFGHSITKADISCGDCHLQNGAGNANLQQYVSSGSITVTEWDATAQGAARLVGPTGVIPIPEDWKTVLKFEFLQYTGQANDPVGADNLPLWDHLKSTADGSHMPYGQPLSVSQMGKLIDN
ncbi:MAG: hypothetical protein AB1792_00885 [Candidatus Zixiibacteriota bacterium]